MQIFHRGKLCTILAYLGHFATRLMLTDFFSLTCLNFNFGGSDLWSCHLSWKKNMHPAAFGSLVGWRAYHLVMGSAIEIWILKAKMGDDYICHELVCEMPGMHLVYALSLSCYHRFCENPFRQSCEVAIWPSLICYLDHGYNRCGRLVDHPKPQLKSYKNTCRNTRFSTIQRSRNCPKLIQQSISPISPFPRHFPIFSRDIRKKQKKILEKIRKNPRDVPFPHWTLRPRLGWSRWPVRWRRPVDPLEGQVLKICPRNGGNLWKGHEKPMCLLENAEEK